MGIDVTTVGHIQALCKSNLSFQTIRKYRPSDRLLTNHPRDIDMRFSSRSQYTFIHKYSDIKNDRNQPLWTLFIA